MYLSHCPINHKFKIDEIWLDYEKREYYKSVGIDEESTVSIIGNDGRHITVISNLSNEEENIETYSILTYHEGLEICGEPVLKKNKTKTKKRI